jgi:hypothetical protein
MKKSKKISRKHIKNDAENQELGSKNKNEIK